MVDQDLSDKKRYQCQLIFILWSWELLVLCHDLGAHIDKNHAGAHGGALCWWLTRCFTGMAFKRKALKLLKRWCSNGRWRLPDLRLPPSPAQLWWPLNLQSVRSFRDQNRLQHICSVLRFGSTNVLFLPGVFQPPGPMADVLPEDPNTEDCECDLNGLAEAWDREAEIRHSTAARKSLLAWQHPKQAGRINYDTLQLNLKVIDVVVDLWCPKQQTAKTVSLDDMKFQAKNPVTKNICILYI